MDVPQVHERQQEASGGGARQAGGAGHVAQGQLGMGGVERPYDGQAALEGQYEVLRSLSHLTHRDQSRHLLAGFAERTPMRYAAEAGIRLGPRRLTSRSSPAAA